MLHEKIGGRLLTEVMGRLKCHEKTNYKTAVRESWMQLADTI
jgi:hypothetical protein